MKFHALALAALLAAPAVAQTAAPAPTAPPIKPVTAVKVILVGDSTMQVHSGWGGAFCSHHVTMFMACVNLGRGGRSTSSYRAEGSWDIALREMKSGGFAQTYVLIQFGHNDQPGKPGRSTDLATEFPANLKHYVEDTRAAGAIPVLVTPLTRRGFKNGKLDDSLQPWADAAIQIAHEMSVPLVDLHARSGEAVQAMGAAEACKLAQVPPSPDVLAAAQTGTTISVASTAVKSDASLTQTQQNAALEPLGQANVSFDYTHLGPLGAALFSKEVTDELAVAVPEMRKYLVP
jgi:lysophospholipase L1-like esterase